MFIRCGHETFNTDHIIQIYRLDEKVYAVFDVMNNDRLCEDIIFTGTDEEDAEKALDKINSMLAGVNLLEEMESD